MDLAAEGIGFWDWELTEGHLVVSPEWLEITGYDKKDLPKIPKITLNSIGNIIEIWSKYIHPDDRDEAVKTLTDYLILNKSSTYNNQFRFRKKNNDYIQIYSNGYAQRDKGKLVRFRVNHVDVTELGGFDRAVLAQLSYMDKAAKDNAENINKKLKKRLWTSNIYAFIFAIALLWASGIIDFIWNSLLIIQENRDNPISGVSRVPYADIVNFPAFYEKQDEITEALKNNLGIYADRAVFGYYEAKPIPNIGRIGAQVKRQSVATIISKDPWFIDNNEILGERRDAHIKGNQYIINNNPYAGLYGAGFQISAPGFWSRPDGPSIAWFVGFECEPSRRCNEDDMDIKSLKEDVEDILNSFIKDTKNGN